MSREAALPRGANSALPRRWSGPSAYVDRGSGEAVVLIHGVGLSADAWQPQIDHLSKTHRVVAIDMPGHGASDRPAADATLGDFVDGIARLLDDLRIEKANIVGHSMGGLVALGFALAHPARTLRLAVLNSVYRRSAEQRAAVEARAQDIVKSASVGDVSLPLSRWFGPRQHWPAVAHDVETWLSAADPVGYRVAYKLFAQSDEAFVGKLNALPMPALFATGSLDQNSTPDMSNAMAAETVRGSALVIDGARHMMNLTHADEVNAALVRLLQMPLAGIDSKDLRRAFGAFMTGVTVVTTKDDEGLLRGFTANSFSSVSLDPPLLLVCLSKASASCAAFSQGRGFAVNILSEAQKDVSGVFASRRPDKFAHVDHRPSASGNPVIAGSVAWFDCTRQESIDAGDHVILIGRVQSYSHGAGAPLGYARGGYFNLALEQTALSARLK